MKKVVRVDYRAKEELISFSNQVQNEFKANFRALELKGRLDFPEAKKLTRYLYEIRINYEGTYRGFYAYAKNTLLYYIFLERKHKRRQLKI